MCRLSSELVINNEIHSAMCTQIEGGNSQASTPFELGEPWADRGTDDLVTGDIRL